MKKYAPALGASSLLTIFAVLALVVFALLSVSTVQAQERLSAQNRQATAAYYEADGKAQEVLAQLRVGEIPEGVTKIQSTYSYTCPISEAQALRVEVTVVGNEYEILRWQAVSTAAWEPDTQLPVWNGQ